MQEKLGPVKLRKMRICYLDAKSPSGRNRRPMSRTCGEHNLNSSRRFLEGTWTCLEGSWKELCLNGWGPQGRVCACVESESMLWLFWGDGREALREGFQGCPAPCSTLLHLPRLGLGRENGSWGGKQRNKQKAIKTVTNEPHYWKSGAVRIYLRKGWFMGIINCTRPTLDDTVIL